MSWLWNKLSGKKDPAAVQADIAALDKKYAEDKAALQTKLTEAQAAESSASATTGTAPELSKGGRRRKGGKHTKKHRKGGKSKRARTGRKSSRL